MKTYLRIPSVEKVDLVRLEQYLLLVNLGGHKYFTLAIYKGGGVMAQDEGPDVDIAQVEEVFVAPKESHIRRPKVVTL